MQGKKSEKGSDLFIVDNSDQDWKVRNYLHEWTDLAHKFDIATGYFEIGALLALDGQWQKLEKIRILMGDEVSRRNLLQEWYERHWEEAQPISEDILKVIERHTHEYSPFEVYAKALQEYFKSYEMTPTQWEQTESRMYPVLDQYQKEGYQALIKIARQYSGAFIMIYSQAAKILLNRHMISRVKRLHMGKVLMRKIIRIQELLVINPVLVEVNEIIYHRVHKKVRREIFHKIM